MIEYLHWHPVASGADVAAVPLAVRLLEQDLVLWRGASGAVQVWADRCPHRGARLSLGQVCDGQLECPYHGWRFDAAGQCQRVPALPAFQPPPTHRAQVHEAREQAGMVWVRLAQALQDGPDGSLPPGSADPPRFEAEQDPRLRRLNCGPYEVATSAGRVVENFLDMAHFAFVHEGWLGMRSLPPGVSGDAMAVPEFQVESSPEGPRARGCLAWQPRSNLHSVAAAQVAYRYEVIGPYTAVLTKLPPPDSVGLAGYQESIALFVAPLTPESSRVWFRLAVADHQSPDESLRAFQHTIFGQDQPVLESQQPRRLPLDPRSECHTAADRLSALYRRHLRALGFRYGTC